MKSVMSHQFATTPRINTPRSRFDRSFGHKTTIDGGWLVPIYHDPVLPGDTFNLRMSAFARLATPLHPIMDNMYLDSHFFFVPYRLIWDKWRKFCGEQDAPADSIDFTIPILSGTNASEADHDYTTNVGRTKALMNYLGVPDGILPTDVDISSLSFRAYNFIYNEWFRDQNLIDSVWMDKTVDGPDSNSSSSSTIFRLMRRGKRHDYFTSALPNPQKGSTAVSLPLGTTAPVETDGLPLSFISDSTVHAIEAVAGGTKTIQSSSNITNYDLLEYNDQGLQVDLSSATAATINDLREAFQTQKLLERDARAGTRYSEIIRNHFGVDFYDVSYRPEYLGGGSSPVNVSAITQNAPTTSGSQLGIGDLAAVGTTSIQGHGFSKTFVEHGLVMGIISVRADLTYQQGLNRHFSHSTRYDVYWPSLAHLGEQAILNKEIYTQGTAADENVFGYIPRYDEYRYKPSMITGLFQSAATGTLDPWHLSQEFSSLPTLGQTFIEENPPIDRVIQVTTEPHFIIDTYFDLKCARPMPVNAIPGMVDHF